MKKSAALLAGLVATTSAHAFSFGEFFGDVFGGIGDVFSGFGAGIYGGADYTVLDVSLYEEVAVDPANADDNNAVTATKRIDTDTTMYKARLGLWLNEDFAIEGQFGVAGDSFDSATNTAEIDSHYGIYITPRAQPFDWLDVLFPVGYAQTDVLVPDTADDGTALQQSVSEGSVAYGMNLIWKVGSFIADEDSFLGSIAIDTGFHVYASDGDNSIRGYNGGIQVGVSF